MPRLTHDVAFASASQRRRRGVAGPERMTAKVGRIAPDGGHVVLDDRGHGPAQATGADLAVPVHRAEERAAGDARGLHPFARRADRAGLGLVAERDADLAALADLVGLILGSRMTMPSATNSMCSTSMPTSSERLNADWKPTSSRARSRVPLSVSGSPATIARRSETVSAALAAGATPSCRRMPERSS